MAEWRMKERFWKGVSVSLEGRVSSKCRWVCCFREVWHLTRRKSERNMSANLTPSPLLLTSFQRWLPQKRLLSFWRDMLSNQTITTSSTTTNHHCHHYHHHHFPLHWCIIMHCINCLSLGFLCSSKIHYEISRTLTQPNKKLDFIKCQWCFFVASFRPGSEIQGGGLTFSTFPGLSTLTLQAASPPLPLWALGYHAMWGLCALSRAWFLLTLLIIPRAPYPEEFETCCSYLWSTLFLGDGAYTALAYTDSTAQAINIQAQ
jgi:hypothetical protein